jgi:hypothetical protein
MRTVIWIVAIVLTAGAILLLIGLGRPPSVSEATADVCADLGAYGRALADLRTIDENSTVTELQETYGAAQESREALQASASALQEAQRTELEATFEALGESVTGIPDDATLAQAQAGLRLATLEALASVVDISTTTCQFTLPAGATTRPQR